MSRVNEAIVWKIARQLSQAGIKPTVDKVRLEIGFGSRTTINRYVQSWRTQHIEPKPVDQVLELKILKQRHQELQRLFDAQAKQLEKISADLLTKEQSILDSAAARQELEQQVLVLQTEKSHHQKYLKRLNFRFQEDLKSLNEHSIKAVRDIGIASQYELVKTRLRLKQTKAELMQSEQQCERLKLELVTAQRQLQPYKNYVLTLQKNNKLVIDTAHEFEVCDEAEGS